jgi:hypothetical protein
MSRLTAACAIALSALAVPASAHAKTYYVNQSDPDAYNTKFVNGNPQVNLCFNPDVPCKTIVYAEDRADGADGNTVRVLPDPAGTQDQYIGNFELGGGGHAVALVGAGPGGGGTFINGEDTAPHQTLRLLDNSTASDVQVNQPYANGIAILDTAAGQLDRVLAEAGSGTAYQGSIGRVFDSTLYARDGSTIGSATAVRVTFVGKDTGLLAVGNFEAASVSDSIVRPIVSGATTGIGVRVAADGSNATLEMRHVTVRGFASRASIEGSSQTATLRAVNSTFAGPAGTTDVVLATTKAGAELTNVNRSPGRTLFVAGATAAALSDTSPIDVEPGLTQDGHLMPGSALVDRGTTGGLFANGPADQLDIDGEPRRQGAAPDVGADELAPAGTTTTQPSFPGVTDPAPVLTDVSLSVRRFRLGPALPRLARRTPTGTILRFTDSEAGKAVVTFARRLAGRRVGRRCLPATRARRRHKRCTRLVTVKGRAISVAAKQGRNRLRFAGTVARGKKLAPGAYQLTLVTVDSAGQRSAPRRLNFRLLPALGRRR